jgi:hypothetical protein
VPARLDAQVQADAQGMARRGAIRLRDDAGGGVPGRDRRSFQRVGGDGGQQQGEQEAAHGIDIGLTSALCEVRCDL